MLPRDQLKIAESFEISGARVCCDQFSL